MKRLLLLTIMLSGIFVFSKGETSGNLVDISADHGLMVRQKPNTEVALSNLFNINRAELPDTIYSVIFRPANCPRCDIFLNNISSQIRNTLHSKSILIAVYPDSVTAKDYIQNHKIDFDIIIYDIEEKFNDFLSFSPGYLHVGYILKIDKASGTLIVGSNADNIKKEFFIDLGKYKQPKSKVDFSAPAPTLNHIEYGNKIEVSDTLQLSKKMLINFPDSLPKMSEIIYRPLYNGRDLIFNDKLALKVFHFKEDSGELKLFQVIEPTRQQAKMYSSLPESQYQAMLKADQLKEMPLSIFDYDDDKIGVAYSLPELWKEGKATGYRNKPCYLVRALNDTSFTEIVALNYEYDDDFFYPHFDMVKIGDNVVVGAQRMTWPLIYDREEFEGDPKLDSFQDAFYEIPQPVFAVYDVDGDSITKRFGALPEFAKKTKTGYSLASTVIDQFDGEFAYANIYEGKVFVSDINYIDCTDCYQVYSLFDINSDNLKSPAENKLYSYTPTHSAKKSFSYYVNEIKISPAEIYAVVSEISDPHHRADFEKSLLVKIDRLTGEKTIVSFPAKRADERRIVNSMRRVNSSIEPFIVSQKSDGNWYLYR